MDPFRRTIVIFVLTVVSAVVSYWVIGAQLLAPARAVVELPQDGPRFDSVEIPRRGGGTLSAWQAGPADARAVVILLHPARANRAVMVERARFLLAAGHATLLPDFQAHGRSDGRRVSYGLREADDVLAFVEHVRRAFPGAAVVTLGVGMGGGASLLAVPELAVEGMVLESVFPDLDTAIANRLRQRFGQAGVHLAPLFASQARRRLGAPREAFVSYARAPEVRAAVLVIAASADRRVPAEQTLRFYELFTARKGIWLVGGAVHQDLHWYATAEYEQRLLDFIARAAGI